jgi:NADH:ubiquinone oxidoreductase subunit E
MENIKDLLKKYPNLNRDSLIPILQDIQDHEGFISEDSVKKVSTHLGLPASKVYGLATFYNQFRFTPPGKYHIQICHGTSCHIKGGENLLKEITKLLQIGDGEMSRDGISVWKYCRALVLAGSRPLCPLMVNIMRR